MKVTWIIEFPLTGFSDQWWELCRCSSSEAACAILLSLWARECQGPPLLRVRMTPAE
jgi:hypothetical protein